MAFRNACYLETENISIRIIIKLIHSWGLYLPLTILNALTSKEVVEHCNMTLWKHDEQGKIYGNMFCKPIPEFSLSELI